jgi:hypothetical protein
MDTQSPRHRHPVPAQSLTSFQTGANDHEEGAKAKRPRADTDSIAIRRHTNRIVQNNGTLGLRKHTTLPYAFTAFKCKKSCMLSYQRQGRMQEARHMAESAIRFRQEIWAELQRHPIHDFWESGSTAISTSAADQSPVAGMCRLEDYPFLALEPLTFCAVAAEAAMNPHQPQPRLLSNTGCPRTPTENIGMSEATLRRVCETPYPRARKNIPDSLEAP